MTHRKLLLVLFVASLVISVFWLTDSRTLLDDRTEDALSTQDTFDGNTHPLNFYDEDAFYWGVENSRKENKVFADHISGGIIPHHLFPGFIIADFFDRLSKQSPQTIILIGPNHHERGNYQGLSSLYGWETPFGVVEPDEQVIQSLIKDKLIEVDESVLPDEHSVAGMMSFVKYYLPDAKVVPIILSGFMSESDILMLSDKLRNYIDENSVIIAAVDFSHGLTNKQAQENDEITLELMSNFDYRQILSLNNDYLDSPPSIVALLMVMQVLQTTNMDLLHNTNSGQIQGNDSIETTSYFSIAYY